MAMSFHISSIARIARSTTGRLKAALRIAPRNGNRTSFGPYTLFEKLGEGAMGAVYRATHDELGEQVAVKLIPADRLSPEAAARFEREAEMTARLSHPNTVRVLDRGVTADGTPWYAMEYLEGATLAEAVATSGPMSVDRVVDVLDQIAAALSEAHDGGFIHRDIKPANIFLTTRDGADMVKLIDFGLVTQFSPPQVADTIPALAKGSLAGTPLYMAPEAIRTPNELDGRTDLYALGAVGYFLLTGQDVFTGRTVLEVCAHHLHTVPIPPSHRAGIALPPELDALLLACLEKDPARRPASAAAVRTALRACRAALAEPERLAA
jgi:eukaryotic-like serine/threonine-protein kinase